MKISKLHIATLVISLALYIFIWNKWNIDYIRSNSLKDKNYATWSLAHNSTIFSIDNYWYTSQIKNYLNKEGFTVNPHKHHYTVRRTPVYPIFYGIHYLLFGEAKSYYFIRFTQVFIFILATFALLMAAYNFTGNNKMAWLAAIMYGFNPTLVTYLYYTITEALSPSLVCFLLYFLSLAYKHHRKRDWMAAGFVFALGALCRPSIVFISFSIGFMLFYLYRNKKYLCVKFGLYFTLGAGLLFAPHIVRNFIVTKGEVVVLEKYYGDPMDYGMPNIALRKWISCWMNPADFSSEKISNAMISHITTGQQANREAFIRHIVDELPERATIVNSEQSVSAALHTLYQYYELKNAPIKNESIDSLDKAACNELLQLEEEIKEKAPFQVYVITPILILKSIIIQSNAYPIPALDNYQLNPVKIIIKGILLLLNIFLFASLLAGLIWMRKHKWLFVFCALYVLTSFTYIIFILHYFEARYLIPIFPVLYITGAIYGYHIAKRISLKITPPDNA